MRVFTVIATLVATVIAPSSAFGWSATLEPAPKMVLPAPVDSNSPVAMGHVFQSAQGVIRVATFPSLAPAWETQIENENPTWLEAIYGNGSTLNGLYHREFRVCGSSLGAPKIGMARSTDGGRTWTDLGIVLESDEAPDCSTSDRYFAGGIGDASMVRQDQYLYIFFSAYDGGTGIGIARLPLSALDAPVGAVRVWDGEEYSQPGLGGSHGLLYGGGMWGPSVHYNTMLGRYVILFNERTDDEWTQGGIRIAASQDLARPDFGEARMLVQAQGWYPQVIGETDSLAGGSPRFFLHGESFSHLVFTADEQPGAVPGGDKAEDVLAPDTVIISAPKAKTTKRTATFEFSSTEQGSTFQCILDGKAEFKPCTSPFTVKVKRGKHTFQVQATDPVGNADSTPATDDWKRKRKN